MAAIYLPSNDPERLDAQLRNLLESADAERASSLSILAHVRRSRYAALEREQRAGNLGADDRRFAELQQRAVAERDAENLLNIEAARAGHVPPEPRHDAWTLYGYVVDREGNGVPALQVALRDYDAHSQPTDSLGHFCLRLTLEEGPKATRAIVRNEGDDVLLTDDEDLHPEPLHVRYLILVLGNSDC